MRCAPAILVLLLCCSAASAQPVPAEDSPLRKKFDFHIKVVDGSRRVVGIASRADVPINDEDLKDLVPFTEATSVSLNGRKINGTGLKHLAGLTKLDTINLAFTAINSQGFEELAKLKTIRRLDLVNTDYQPEDLKTLTALADLEMLWLGQCFACEDEDYKVLGAFKKLRGLSVGNSNFGDAALKAVAGLPELRTIIFHGSNVTDDGLAPLARAPKLERFKGNFNMGEKGLAHLGRIDTLREIDLYGSRVSVEAILALPNIKKITRLKLDFRGDKAEDDAKRVKAALPDCEFDFFHWTFDR